MTSARAAPASGMFEMEGAEMPFSEAFMTMPCTSLFSDTTASSFGSAGFDDDVPTPPDWVVLNLSEESPEEWLLEGALLL